MFSYRHGFHAGNHADVLKHSILIHILNYFNLKENPYWFIDTHAGAGVYDLGDEWSEKTAEFHEGILRLWDKENLPPLLNDYIAHIKELNDDKDLQFYPGSPWIAMSLAREKDKIRLFELHPTEIDVLNDNIQHQNQSVRRQIKTYEENGFTGLKALLPVPTRRAVTLIDPSYEDKRDYKFTINAIKEGLERFATGCFIVWYPLVQRKELHDFINHLEKLPNTRWLHASLTVRKSQGLGLNGSGMFIINPPYTLYPALQQAMPEMKKLLAQDELAEFLLKQKDN